MKGCQENLLNTCPVVFLSPSHENIRYYSITLLPFLTHLHSTMYPHVSPYSVTLFGFPYVTILPIITNYSYFPSLQYTCYRQNHTVLSYLLAFLLPLPLHSLHIDTTYTPKSHTLLPFSHPADHNFLFSIPFTSYRSSTGIHCLPAISEIKIK